MTALEKLEYVANGYHLPLSVEILPPGELWNRKVIVHIGKFTWGSPDAGKPIEHQLAHLANEVVLWELARHRAESGRGAFCGKT